VNTPFRVYKLGDFNGGDVEAFEHVGEVVADYGKPTAQQLGEQFGVGSYLVVDVEPRYSHHEAHYLTVVQDAPVYSYVDENAAVIA
jgi:hypothetical protein